MQAAFSQFLGNISRVRTLGVLHTTLTRLTTPAIDASDILRAQIVMAVSALDLYIHEITLVGMLEVYYGKRAQTPAFKKFGVTIDTVLQNAQNVRNNSWFESIIREKLGYQAFQQPDKIADTIRFFSNIRLWRRISVNLGIAESDLKNRLHLIIDRRNKIVHEADLDPSYPGVRWPISDADVNTSIDFIGQVCGAISQIIT